MRDSPEIAIMKGDKETFIQMIKDNYKTKTEFFLFDLYSIQLNRVLFILSNVFC